MPSLEPVEYDPFAQQQAAPQARAAPSLEPVDYDPFAGGAGQEQAAQINAENGQVQPQVVHRGFIAPLVEYDNGKVSFGMPQVGMPLLAGMELIRHGYKPSIEDVSSENNTGDLQGIKLAAQAAPAGMSTTNLSGPTREGVNRAVAQEVANTKAFGPNTQVANSGIPQRWMDKFAPTARDETLAAGERQGVPVPSHVASESGAVRGIAGGLAGIPVLGSPVAAANARMAENMGNRVAELAGNATREASIPGAEVKTGLLDWTQKGFRSAMDGAYAPLDKLINPNTLVPLSKTAQAAKALTRADVESASEDGQQVLKLVNEALDRGNLTYAGLKELRTRIGERLNGDIAPEAGTSARALKSLYGALSEDLKFGVGQAGKGVKGGGIAKAQAAFEAANNKASELFDLRSRLTDIVGREGDASAESVFHRLAAMASSGARGDVLKLQQARDAAGASWGKVVDTITARLGVDEKTGIFSPDRFLTHYNKNLSDEGKKILFSSDHRKALDDIALLSEAWSGAGKFGNPSGSGRAVGVLGAIATAVKAPLFLLADAATGFTLGHILSRPAGAKAVREFMRSYTAAVSNPAERVTYQAAARRMAEIVNAVNAGEEIPESGRSTTIEKTPPSGPGRFARNALAGDAGSNTGDNVLRGRVTYDRNALRR